MSELEGFKQLIDLKIRARGEVLEPIRSAQEAFRASDSGGCPRVAIMGRAKLPETRVEFMTPEERLIQLGGYFQGEQLERTVVETYEECGLNPLTQLKFRSTSLDVTGNADCLWGGDVIHKPELKEHWSDTYKQIRINIYQHMIREFGKGVMPFVLDEIKSMGEYAVKKKLQGEGGDEGYRIQLGLYKIMNDDLQLFNIDRYQLTMVGKKDLQVFHFPLTEEDVNLAWERLVLLNKTWSAQTDPGCNCGKDLETGEPDKDSAWKIQFCRYGNNTRVQGSCCTDEQLAAAYELAAEGGSDG